MMCSGLAIVAMVERCILKALGVELHEETRIAKRNVVGLLKEVVRIRKDEMFIVHDAN